MLPSTECGLCCVVSTKKKKKTSPGSHQTHTKRSRGPVVSKFVVKTVAPPPQKRFSLSVVPNDRRTVSFPTLFCRLPLLRSFQTQQQATALDAKRAPRPYTITRETRGAAPCLGCGITGFVVRIRILEPLTYAHPAVNAVFTDASRPFSCTCACVPAFRGEGGGRYIARNHARIGCWWSLLHRYAAGALLVRCWCGALLARCWGT